MENPSRAYLVLEYGAIDEDDVDQEIALLRLQGKERVSRRIVRLRLHNENRSLLAGLLNGSEDEGAGLDLAPSAFGEAEFDPEALQRILTWGISQDTVIQRLVFEYLEYPEEATLMRIAGAISRESAIVEPASTLPLPQKKTTITASPTQQSPNTVSGLVLRSLPASFDTLVQIVSQAHSTKRPDATVRQLLRRWTKEGKVILKEGEYHERKSSLRSRK